MSFSFPPNMHMGVLPRFPGCIPIPPYGDSYLGALFISKCCLRYRIVGSFGALFNQEISHGHGSARGNGRIAIREAILSATHERRRCSGARGRGAGGGGRGQGVFALILSTDSLSPSIRLPHAFRHAKIVSRHSTRTNAGSSNVFQKNPAPCRRVPHFHV